MRKPLVRETLENRLVGRLGIGMGHEKRSFGNY
jgi:hypothetical protein